MAITTLDGAIAGLQPVVSYAKVASQVPVIDRLNSMHRNNGSPDEGMVNPANVGSPPGMAGEVLSAPVQGQLNFVNGAAKQYLAKFSGSMQQVGTIYLCDMLWRNSGIVVTTTTAQTINSLAWPARDENGSKGGWGVHIGMHVEVQTGAGASALSIVYTNESGTGTRAGVARVPYTAVSTLGAMYDFTLQAGDRGVKSVQSFTSTVSMTSGTVCLYAYRIIAKLPCPVANVEYSIDPITGGLPEMYDDSVPFLMFRPSSVATTILTGQFQQTNG